MAVIYILRKIDNDNRFLSNLIFSDEATFHISGRVNRHNYRFREKEIHTSYINMNEIHQKLMCGVRWEKIACTDYSSSMNEL